MGSSHLIHIREDSVPHVSLWKASRRETNSLGRKILEDFTLTLEPSLQKRFLPLLNELKKEPNEAFLLRGLLQVGVRLKSEGETSAQLLLRRLSYADIPQEIRQQAEREYGAMAGFGSFGMRAEYLGSRLAGDSANLRTIAPMLGATALGQVAGTAVLGRLAVSPARGFLIGQLGARLTAGTAAFLIEFPAFAGLSRALSPTPDGAFTDDLARSALTLGMLRFFNGIGQKFVGASRGAAPIGPFGAPAWIRNVIPQTSTFLGLLAANKLEQHFHLRPIVDGATTLTDTFSSLIALGIGNHLGRRGLGRQFARFQAELGIRARGFPQNNAGTRFLSATGPLSAETATPGANSILAGLDWRGFLPRASQREALSKPVWNMSDHRTGDPGGKKLPRLPNQMASDSPASGDSGSSRIVPSQVLDPKWDDKTPPNTESTLLAQSELALARRQEAARVDAQVSNKKILGADEKEIHSKGVYYVPARQSIGRVAGKGKMFINTAVDPETSQITAVGEFESLPEDIIDTTVEVIFVVQVVPDNFDGSFNNHDDFTPHIAELHLLQPNRMTDQTRQKLLELKGVPFRQLLSPYPPR